MFNAQTSSMKDAYPLTTDSLFTHDTVFAEAYAEASTMDWLTPQAYPGVEPFHEGWTLSETGTGASVKEDKFFKQLSEQVSKAVKGTMNAIKTDPKGTLKAFGGAALSQGLNTVANVSTNPKECTSLITSLGDLVQKRTPRTVFCGVLNTSKSLPVIGTFIQSASSIANIA